MKKIDESSHLTESAGSGSHNNSDNAKPRGFAAMDRAKVSEIASRGGKAAHAQGTAHKFTSEEARAAGKKGGVAPHVRRGRGPARGIKAE